ncbi:LysR family transcriptional regulator [Sneathiella chungangensis]|uniref:LysR family transcriptional regulator n=1 Tax=Sneathiella chungangensis TaxID=1418234 RepID=A0A845MI35_9PROT|nr:LysR family transcriptional regulator [Sneathiella chungangensis]MZR22996.1 LysR family transcriptional regulator [Sneathiella chungangensis]
MQLSHLDLNLFLTFEAIYTHGNLTLAARTLNVTQPAVSNALARLRDRLDDPLFIHAGKRMNPTPMAQRMIGPVRQALRLLQSGISAAEEFDPALSDKTVRIAIGDIGETILLPRLVERLRRLAPVMKIQAFNVPRRSIPRKLSLGEIDFAVDIPLLANTQLMYDKLMSDDQVCAVGRHHPLATQHTLTIDDYLAMSHILVSSRSRGGGLVDIELDRKGMSRQISVRLQHYQAAFHMIKEIDLAVTAPLQLTRMYDCRTFPLPLEVPKLDLYLYWHISADQTAVNRWLRQQIFAAL